MSIASKIAELEKQADATPPATSNKFQQYKEEHPGTKKQPNDPMFLSQKTTSGKGIPTPQHPIYQKELKGETLAHDLPHYSSKDHRDAAALYKGHDQTRHIGYAHHAAADHLDFKARQQQEPPRRVATDAMQKAIDALNEHAKAPKKKPTPEQTKAVMDKHQDWKKQDEAKKPAAPQKNKFQEYKTEHPLTKKQPNDPMFLNEKTRSGKDIPSHQHPAYKAESEFHGAHDAARDFKGWTPEDHDDAAKAHMAKGGSPRNAVSPAMIHQDAAHLLRNKKPHYSETPEWQGQAPAKAASKN